MKKNNLKFCILFILLLSVMLPHNSMAQLPFAASFDFGAEIKGVIQDIQASLKSVETNIVGVWKGNLSKLQAAFDQYSGKITKVFNKIPGTKDFKIGSTIGINSGSNSGSIFGSILGANSAIASGGSMQSVDIYNAASVKEAFEELFLTYPSTEKRAQIAYDNMSNKFYYDTLIEVRAAITGLEEQLDKLRKEVEDFSEQAMSAPEGGAESGDSDGATSAEDESGVIYNAYLSNRKFNDILKVTEEVVALQNQYYAAKLMRRPRKVVPSIPNNRSGQQSFIIFSQSLAYAQYVKNESTNKSYYQNNASDLDSKMGIYSTEKSAIKQNDGGIVGKEITFTEKSDGQAKLSPVEQKITSSEYKTISAKQSQEESILSKKDALDEKSDVKSTAKEDTVISTDLQKTSITSRQYVSEKQPQNDKEIADTSVKKISSSSKITEASDTISNSPKIINSGKDDTYIQQKDESGVNAENKLSGSSRTNYYDDDDFFAVPAAPETSSPLKYSVAELEALNKIAEANTLVDKAKDVHNLLQQLPSYQDTFKQFGLIKRIHEKAKAALERADGCVTRYLGYYYNNPNNIWYGQSTIPTNRFDYDSRKGLSGVAIEAYQLANASSGNNIDISELTNPVPGAEDGDPELIEFDTDKLSKKTEGFVTPAIDISDSDNGYSDSVRDLDPEKMAEERDGETESLEDNFTDSNKAKEFTTTSREVSLINWQVGKAITQYLAQDQNKQNPEYGKPYRPYELWNDERSYYDQYISGKYGNMKAYINQLNVGESALGIVELFNSVTENEEEKQSIANGISAIANALNNNVGVSDPLASIMQARNSAIATLKQQQKSKLENKQEKLDKANNNLQAVTQQISKINEEINESSNDVTSNDSTANSSQQFLDILNRRGTNPLSSLFSQAREKLQEAIGNLSIEGTRLNLLKVELKTLEVTRKALKERVNKLSEDIEELIQEQQMELETAESDWDAMIVTAQENIQSPKLSDVLSAISISDTNLEELINKADVLVDKARECAAQLIDEHLQELQASAAGDMLYKSSNHQNVVNKHNQLINKLKNLPSACLLNTVQSQIGILEISEQIIMGQLQNIFQSALTSDICSEYDCNTPDSDYFVGQVAKKRDFTAPRSLSVEAHPTVRDIVHLDTTDYKNIKMSKHGRITRDAFLEYGAEMPSIWTRLLSDNSYVERRANLSPILNKGGEDKAFLRGMMLPCKLGRYVIDANENNGKYKVLDTVEDATYAETLEFNKLADCQELEVIIHVIDSYTLKDTDVKDNIHGTGTNEIEDPVSSELGMFLKYENGHLSINDRPFDGIGTLVEKEKKAEKKGKLNLKAEDNVYERALFAKNQIGEFLHFMNKEKEAREKLEQAEEDIAELRETLKQAVSELGFELSDDVNLANQEDYDEVVQKLKTSKNTIMGQAIVKLNNTKDLAQSNADVYERYYKAKNTYDALVQDNKALVNISANTEAGNDLKESIKSEEANKKVVEKSRNDGYKALQDEIDNYEQPICIPNGVIVPTSQVNN